MPVFVVIDGMSMRKKDVEKRRRKELMMMMNKDMRGKR
jgi:hypothetical protein